MPKVPVLVVTGYLGAGKTTLLLHLIEKGGKKLAIVMNEFGEIDIDGRLIAGKNVLMKELAGGCVCCSMAGEFEEAIKEILEKARPDLIVLETTGVAEPDAILEDIEQNMEGIKLEAVVAVADADALSRFPSLGHTGRVQLEMADIIILNKTDLVKPEQIVDIEKRLRELNGKALIYPATGCRVPVEILLGPAKRPGKKAESHRGHDLSEVESFSYASEKQLSRQKFEAFADSMPSQIYRSKGFVLLEEGPFLFNFVAGRWDLEKSAAKKTEIVFIGKDISSLKKSILQKLQECEL